MVDVTLQVPEQLAEKLQPMQEWLAPILELSLVGYRTSATETATEVIEFLATNPSRDDVLAYHASERSQNRLVRLLALNEGGLVSESENRELDELQQIEHIMIMLKARIAQQRHHGS